MTFRNANEILSFLISEPSKRLSISDYKVQSLVLTFPSCFPLPLQPVTLVSLLLFEYMSYASTRSLPLLFPLATVLFPRIHTGLLYYFIQVSLQISSTQKGLPGWPYLSSNSPLPITGYLSPKFSHSVNSTALHYIMYIFVYFCLLPWNVRFLGSGI